jgi:hypothetical protein
VIDEQKSRWDIFVSYRHVADEDHWVTNFCKGLATRINDQLGEKPRIFQDLAQLRAGDEWRPELERALESAPIFLAIISQSYFRSQVCRQEMDVFLGLYKQASATLPRLICPVYKQPPPPDLPPDINEFHRPRLFYQDNPPGWDEFAPERSRANDFYDALAKVAQELTHQLQKIRKSAPPQTLGSIYLAEVGRELLRERENLQSDLFQRRYAVFPDKCYMWNASDIGTRIDADLNAADLSVHLIGYGTPGRPETVVRARDQLDRAVATMSRRGKPAPLVWIQPDGDATDPAVWDLIDYVKTELPDRGVEVYECALEEFKSSIVSRLPRAPAQAVAATAATAVARGANEVGLILDSTDVLASKALKLELVEELGCEPLPVRLSECGVLSPGGVKLPRGCERCIIFWGAQPEAWVRAVLGAESLARHVGKEQLCLYIAGPESEEKASFVTGKARVIHAGGHRDELREFVTTRKSLL